MHRLTSFLASEEQSTVYDPEYIRGVFSCLPRLESKRLLLRPVSLRDALDMYEYSRDPEVARHVLWDAHRSVSDSRHYIRYMLRQYRDGQPSSYAMVSKTEGRVIGTIGFMAFSEENRSVEIGYSMARRLWGQGLMAEAIQLLLKLCFERMHLHRVEAMHETGNPNSGIVLQKCGFQREGILRDRVWNKGSFHDVAIWGITEKDWCSMRDPSAGK